MSLTVTQRPYQTINSERSHWNAVGNTVLYKMQRKDFTFTQVNNNGGFVQLQFDGVDITGSFSNGASLYVQSDNGVYDASGLQTAEAFSGGNTLITTDIAYTATAPGGFVNNDTLRPLYRVEVDVYDQDDTLLTESPFSYSPTSKGALSIDISAILRAQMSPDNDADLTSSSKTFLDENASIGFYIKYNEVWTGSANSPTNDSDCVQYALLGAMQIPSTYGGNIYEYLILSDMKIESVTMTAAQILASNATPVTIVAAPGAGYVIVPVKFFLFLDYGTAAYAANTTFRFEINGVAVSATNTTMLPGVADRYTTMEPTDYDTTTDLKNQALVFETQTGNPTTGDSPIRVVCIYTVKSVA
jgi:hypothetical protein